MIVTGHTSEPAKREAGQHKAARRALVGWKLHRVGGRRRAGVPTAAAPVVPLQAWQRRVLVDQLGPELAERAERFHNYGVTR